MIVITIKNEGDKQRIWIKEFAGDQEPLCSIEIETLLDWNEDCSDGNRIRIDRLKEK